MKELTRPDSVLNCTVLVQARRLLSLKPQKLSETARVLGHSGWVRLQTLGSNAATPLYGKVIADEHGIDPTGEKGTKRSEWHDRADRRTSSPSSFTTKVTFAGTYHGDSDLQLERINVLLPHWLRVGT